MDRVYNANRNIWYISSYFLLFKKNAFLSDIFKIHMESITIEKNLLNVINKYEIPFMEKFYNNAYIVKSLLSEQYQIYYSWRENIAEGNPFVKRKVFLKSHFLGCNSFGWEEYIKNTSKYPIEFIKDYLKDNKNYSENIDELIKNNELKTKLSLKEKLVKIRQWIIQINIKKNKKKIRILGLYILNTNSQIIPISLINKGKTK